jgi:hypothetical protein
MPKPQHAKHTDSGIETQKAAGGFVERVPRLGSFLWMKLNHPIILDISTSLPIFHVDLIGLRARGDAAHIQLLQSAFILGNGPLGARLAPPSYYQVTVN